MGENRSHAKLLRHGVSPEFYPEKFTYHPEKHEYTCLNV
jgi:hypothetical protein